MGRQVQKRETYARDVQHLFRLRSALCLSDDEQEMIEEAKHHLDRLVDVLRRLERAKVPPPEKSEESLRVFTRLQVASNKRRK